VGEKGGGAGEEVVVEVVVEEEEEERVVVHTPNAHSLLRPPRDVPPLGVRAVGSGWMEGVGRPHEDVCLQRYQEWKLKFDDRLGRTVVMLTGETSADLPGAPLDPNPSIRGGTVGPPISQSRPQSLLGAVGQSPWRRVG